MICFSGYINAIVGKMNILIFIKPYMPVNSRSFIEPAFVLSGVNPYYQNIRSAEINVICYIIRFPDISAFIISKVKPIQPYICIAENSIELDLEPLP